MHVGRQFQQPHHIGDDRAALADLAGDILLAEPKFLCEALIGHRFFNRIKILALDVLDESQLKDFLIAGFPDNNGRFLQPHDLRSPPAPFARDQFIFFVTPTDDQRLDDSAIPDGIHQLLEPLRPEMGARLERTRRNFGNRHLLHPVAGFDDRIRSGETRLD